VTTGFNSGVYTRDALHFSHAVTAQGGSKAIDWQVVGTLYNYAHDLQNGPSTAASGPTVNKLPSAFAGGAGTIQRQDGTGWVTLDAKAALHLGAHEVSFGGHGDRYKLAAQTFLASNWLDTATQGALSTASRGKTRTLAVWAQDAIRITPQWTLTLGARQEWWRAWDGYNLIASGASVTQAERKASGFRPRRRSNGNRRRTGPRAFRSGRRGASRPWANSIRRPRSARCQSQPQPAPRTRAQRRTGDRAAGRPRHNARIAVQRSDRRRADLADQHQHRGITSSYVQNVDRRGRAASNWRSTGATCCRASTWPAA
jgi:iron complex outermembrane receptor protein